MVRIGLSIRASSLPPWPCHQLSSLATGMATASSRVLRRFDAAWSLYWLGGLRHHDASRSVILACCGSCRIRPLLGSKRVDEENPSTGVIAAVAAKRRTSGQQRGGTAATACRGVAVVLGRTLRDGHEGVSLPEVAVPAVCAIFERVFGPAKDTPVVYCFKGSACRPGKKRKGGALPRRLLALASLSVLPVPRSRMSGGRVLRVVRMRFLHCFLSRHCDVFRCRCRRGAVPHGPHGGRWLAVPPDQCACY